MAPGQLNRYETGPSPVRSHIRFQFLFTSRTAATSILDRIMAELWDAGRDEEDPLFHPPASSLLNRRHSKRTS
ncbi:MAG: hypothetical protein LBC51_07895 [Treponema sp.]|nr:hypothetical protein [Treponema sp.]